MKSGRSPIQRTDHANPHRQRRDPPAALAAAGEGIHALTAQFGYWLGEPFWGRGIATCAARALLQHALARLPFVRYEAPVFAWNPASMRVLEKVGFVREAVLRRSVSKGDELTDAVLYAYVREEGAAGAYHPLAASA